MRRSRLSLALALVVATSAAVVAPSVASAAPRHGQPPVADVPVQLLAMNDFHGRISTTTNGDSELVVGPGPDGLHGDQTPDDRTDPVDDETITVGGAANIAGTVDAAQQTFVEQGGSEQATFFVGAGDLVSASPYNSSAFKDEPTIEVLDAMGLDVSSVGNHEFDRGTEELRRISGATDGTFTDDVEACEGIVPGETGCFGEGEHAFDGADFPFLAANVISKETGEPMLPPYQVIEVGGGKKIALIGVVTDTTPSIVAPAGITDVEFIDEAEAVNRWVPVLQEEGIEAIGVLVHEGGESTGEDAELANGCDFLSGPVVDINNAVVPAVDLIVSAHSHQAYDCLLTDPAGAPRLVTQAGYYGRLVTDIRLTLDGRTGDVDRYCADYRAVNVPVTRDAPDEEVASIVAYWEERGLEEGSVPVGSTTAAMTRPDRSTESSLGNLVAEMQLQAVQEEQYGSPVIAFMNPGGLRADLPAGELTFADLFAVQPFGNTVNTITLTGADIRAVLEQQFQLDQPRGTVLALGTSEGFAYSYDLAQPYGQRVDPATITLDGVLIDPAGNYRVAANSFLIAGGDQFSAFTNGTAPATGPLDVDSAVFYFEQNSPVAPPAADHGTATTFTTPPAPAEGLGGSGEEPAEPTTVDGTPAVEGPQTPGPACDATAAISDDEVRPGDEVTVTGTKFSRGEKVSATLGDRTVGSARADRNGTVEIRFRVPRDVQPGKYEVVLTGKSGETASVALAVASGGSGGPAPTPTPTPDTVKQFIQDLVAKLLIWLSNR
ncbi:bifunctional metallophosphatase/5'-nucleotidase [Blastococcus saxobsidens]|uniref:Putative 5'-nucleotidase n=1 Tax=Blastococcus saxobsidens (strain DD2) TaxID=1146883 RepID=H6RX87_BLASD|nr:bifunctional metallophosphatase/5'-nucleotidase [Blastococcus saxobsidens]CCG04698.1 Putative 5'-nucleotidase [Blastococcus saxobsidens DD2]